MKKASFFSCLAFWFCCVSCEEQFRESAKREFSLRIPAGDFRNFSALRLVDPPKLIAKPSDIIESIEKQRKLQEKVVERGKNESIVRKPPAGALRRPPLRVRIPDIEKANSTTNRFSIRNSMASQVGLHSKEAGSGRIERMPPTFALAPNQMSRDSPQYPQVFVVLMAPSDREVFLRNKLNSKPSQSQDLPSQNEDVSVTNEKIFLHVLKSPNSLKENANREKVIEFASDEPYYWQTSFGDN